MLKWFINAEVAAGAIGQQAIAKPPYFLAYFLFMCSNMQHALLLTDYTWSRRDRRENYRSSSPPPHPLPPPTTPLHTLQAEVVAGKKIVLLVLSVLCRLPGGKEYAKASNFQLAFSQCFMNKEEEDIAGSDITS